DGIFCKRCTCKSCGKDAHIGYNCPSKVLVISNPESCNNQTIDELSQTLPIFHPTFHSEAETPFTLDSTLTYVDESPNAFNPPPQSLSSVIHQPPQELSIPEMEDLKQQYLDELQRLSNLEYRDEIKIAELKENFNGMSIEIRKKEKLLQEEQRAYLSTHPLKRLTSLCFDDDDDDDDEDYTSAITPDEHVLSTEEPDDSLSMGDEHLDTIPATESNEFIKSGVETLIPILSESEGIPEHVCDVPFHDSSPPLDVSTDQIEDFSESNEEFSSTDDDSFSFDNIDYVEVSPPDSKFVSSEVMEIVISEVGGIKASNDNPIPFYDPSISGTPPNLTSSGESDFFSEVDAFLAVEDQFTSSQSPKSYLGPEGDMLLFKTFLNDDYSFDFKTKSSSTSLNSLLEETNNFNNSLPEFTTFLNVLCDAECESDSSDDQSCSDEDVLEKIVSKPLCEEEIVPMKSLRTHDSSLPISSKIDSLLDEFAGELALLKSIPLGIDETDCDFEEDIQEIDLFCTPDYPMPPSIVDKDYNSERDILIPKDLPSNNSLSFAEK
nr:hypothetical protein [Tanacetum cinerariifolium]